MRIRPFYRLTNVPNSDRLGTKRAYIAAHARIDPFFGIQRGAPNKNFTPVNHTPDICNEPNTSTRAIDVESEVIPAVYPDRARALRPGRVPADGRPDAQLRRRRQ